MFVFASGVIAASASDCGHTVLPNVVICDNRSNATIAPKALTRSLPDPVLHVQSVLEANFDFTEHQI